MPFNHLIFVLSMKMLMHTIKLRSGNIRLLCQTTVSRSLTMTTWHMCGSLCRSDISKKIKTWNRVFILSVYVCISFAPSIHAVNHLLIVVKSSYQYRYNYIHHLIDRWTTLGTFCDFLHRIYQLFTHCNWAMRLETLICRKSFYWVINFLISQMTRKSI